jgi:outer membrane protein TolC
VIIAAPDIDVPQDHAESLSDAQHFLPVDEQPIDLTTALLLTTGQNPQVAFAKARIEESLAQLDKANALKLPTIRAGVNYNKHEGRIQDVAGTVIETSRGSYFSGLGANAVGAGSPAVPGLVSQFHVADAIFQPRIAQRTTSARQAGAIAVNNDLLMATAVAYTELLRSAQELAVNEAIVQRAEQLEKTTAEFEKVGEGLASDHDRARTELALRKNARSRAEEAMDVASARLAELVRWDASQRLVPAEPQLVPIELVMESGEPREMVALALSNRPELAESRHLVGEALERLRREQKAPLVPSVLLSASYGGLGGGLGGNLTNFGDRFDADAVAYWEVRQLGVGERAGQREARSKITQARMREIATMDRIAREVHESRTQVSSRRKQIETSREAVQAAEDSFDKNWDRIRNGKGLPIEALQAIQALANAQSEYIRAVSDFNVAQFTLQRSLGWPIRGTPE